MANVDLRELQLYELNVLKEMDRVCKENNLRYFLACGTLLGAIRHQGFIPWDDDIDVYMPYEDYVKFSKIAPEKLRSDFYFSSRELNPENYIYWNRIGVKSSTSINMNRAHIHMDWGICIDIFPLMPFPSDKEEQNKKLKEFKVFNLLSLKYLHSKTVHEAQGIMKVKKIVHKLIPDQLNMRLFNSYFTKLANVTDSDYVVDYEFIDKAILKKEWFNETVEVPFEDATFPAPAGYDSYLRSVYGDYWIVPDENNREKHSDDPSVVIDFNKPFTDYLK